MSNLSDAFAYGLQASQINQNQQAQALGNSQALGLGKQSITDHQALAQQWRDMNTQSFDTRRTSRDALAQQWRDRADDQHRFALQAKCEEAYQDHMDNAARFDQWARETDDTSHMSQPAIDYFQITREMSA